MRLSANDYKNLAGTRLTEIQRIIYPQNYGQPVGFGAEPDAGTVPDFERIRTLVTEIQEIAEEYETSIGPA